MAVRDVATVPIASVLLGMASLVSPTAARAQQESSTSVTVRAVTPFEVQVERLARGLVASRQRAVQLAGERLRLQVTLKSAGLPEGERDVLAVQVRRLAEQLESIEATRFAMRRELEQLCAPSRQTEGWMGITFQSNYVVDVSREGLQLTHFKDYPAIETVEPNSPAEKAGVRRGDVLLSLAGRDLQDAAVVFQDLLKPGARLQLKLRRGLESKTFTMMVEARPADWQPTCAWEDDLLAAALAPVPGAPPYRFSISGGGQRGTPIVIEPRAPAPVEQGAPPGGARGLYGYSNPGPAWAGIQLAALNDGLAVLVGVARGVFVVDVAKRSKAALSGLRGGDVIVAADGQAVGSPSMLRQILLQRADTRELTLEVVRDRKGETIVLRW